MDLLKKEKENRENTENFLQYISKIENPETKSDIFNVYCDVRNKLIYDMAKKSILNDLKNNLERGEIQSIYNRLHPVDTSKLKYHVFLTLSFKDDVNPDIIRVTLDKFLQKNWIKTIHVYHEQRGTTQGSMGQGYHIHCIIETLGAKSKEHIIRETYNTFKGYLNGKNFIDCKYIKSTIDLQKVQSYVDGNKESDKMDKVEIDKLFKARYNVN